MPGCGNSDLGPQIAAAGFGRVTNVDYISVVIKNMQEKYGCVPDPKFATLVGRRAGG